MRSDITLRVNRVHYPVTALGYGRRLGVWLQGCPLACRGCVSRDTWDPKGGHDVAVADLAEVWRTAVASGADGLTVSGGEPLTQPGGLSAFLDAADELRGGEDRDIDILVYTGYEVAEFDQARHLALRHADVVITGRYDVTRPTELIWRGSANQTMVLRTPLGHTRYETSLDSRPERGPIQLAVDGDNVWMIGVPRSGDLPRLERLLRVQGLVLRDPSWRPRRGAP